MANTTKEYCISCASRYDAACTDCSKTECLSCGPGKTVTDNKLGCRDEGCNITNCITCAGNLACSVCAPGFKYSQANRTCDAMSCSVVGCAICSNASCTNCMQGYSFKNGTCNPVCDRYCDTCTTPNNCGLCKVNYIFDDTIKACKLDCSQGFGGNCAECSSLLFCSRCKEGYIPFFFGAICSFNTKCTDGNCMDCTGNATQCLTCKTGYKLSNGTCAKDLCNIANCLTCDTVTTCTVCQENYIPYTPSTGNSTGASNATDGNSTNSTNATVAGGKTCQPACLSVVANCLTCSSATACKFCAIGFELKSSSCEKACSNANCDVCASSTNCKTCATGYKVSDGNCVMDCGDDYCATCSSTS